MKKSLALLLVTTSLFAYSACGSSTKGSDRASAATSSTKSTEATPKESAATAPAVNTDVAKYEVMQVERDWASAYIKKDGDFFNSHVANDYIGVESDGSLTNKDQHILGLANAPAYEYLNADDMKAAIYGDLAVLVGREQYRGQNTDGSSLAGQYRFTDLFLKKGDVWQAIASVSSDNANVASALPEAPTIPAVPKEPLETLSSSESVKNELTQLERDLYQAYIKADADFCNKYLGEEFISVDTDGKVDNKETTLSSIANLAGEFDYINPSDMNVRVYNNAAVINGTCTLKARGSASAGQYKFVDVWVKRSGRWQMVAGQNSNIYTP